MYPQPVCKNSQGWCKNHFKISVLDVVLKSKAEMKHGQTLMSKLKHNCFGGTRAINASVRMFLR